MQDIKALENKAITGLIWSFADLFVNRGIQFSIQIILARLLLPEHFGLIGMVLVFIAISETVIDSGFSQALIRDENTTQEDYSTVFYFNLMIAFVLYFLFYISAGGISNFYGEPQLIEIIRVLSLVLIINSLGIIQRVMVVKKVDFKTITKASIIAIIFSGSITITMALLGYGVWSLVVNIITLQFVQTICLWIFNRWVPSLTFKRKSFKKYFTFGYKILLAGLLETFYNNIYFLVIGKLYSTTQLGLYTHAIKFRDLATHSISTAVQRVSFPVLSSIQEDELKLKDGFRKIFKMFAFLNFPLMLGLASVAEPLFFLLFGEQWLPSVIYFQLLCIGGMISPLHAINLDILLVKGRSDLFLLLEIINKAILTILILMSLWYEWGVIGLIWVSIINSYISLIINTYFSAKEIGYLMKEQLKDLLPAFLSSLVMGAVVYTMDSILSADPFIKITCQISIGVFIYGVICKVAKIREANTLLQLVILLMKKIKS